ncbi:MAG: outer membrane beta-barrel protein [Labilibaculum sp.]|nr:outer membrane beta-barrel protein [Labilibaculum sp.]
MRLIFTICTLFCCTSLLLGQTEKGKIFIGGQSSLSFSSMDNELKSDLGDEDQGSTTTFEFVPQMGYFVADGLVIGAELGFSSSKEKEDGYEYKTSTIALGPFVRYYFGKTNVKPYLHGGFGFGSASEKEEGYGSDEEDYKLSVYGFGGGVGIFINEKIAIDLGVGYSSVTVKPDEDYDGDPKIVTNGIGFNVGFSISL